MTDSTAPPPAAAWSDDLALALDAVRAAGRAIMDVFGTDLEVRHKGPDQPVTEADLTADAILKERLLRGRPDYGWLSEESVDRPERLSRSRVWIVDPVDGTRSFIAGYPEFAVSVALAVDGKPAVGVIYNPARDHVVWATAGGGAWGVEGWSGVEAELEAPESDAGAGAEARDGDDRTSAAGAPLDIDAGAPNALLVSRSERRAGEFEAFEVDWTLREVGSTAWKLAGAAMGRGAYMSRGPKSEWDVAAGVLIVAEAGGRVTDLAGRTITLNRPEPHVHGVVAGGAEAHARLLDRARALPAPRLDRDHRNQDELG